MLEREFLDREYRAADRFFYPDPDGQTTQTLGVYRQYTCNCGFKTNSVREIFKHIALKEVLDA